MTKEQLKRAKILAKEYELENNDAEIVLLYIGIFYDLSESDIQSYLGDLELEIEEKHLRMLCRILGIEDEEMDRARETERKEENSSDIGGDGQSGSESQSGSSSGLCPKELLERILREHYCPQKGMEKPYEDVIQFILNDSQLSAAQIEQLRLAAKAGVPEDEVMKMAKGNKEPMEIKRCVEFYQMVHSVPVKKRKRHD